MEWAGLIWLHLGLTDLSGLSKYVRDRTLQWPYFYKPGMR